MQSTASTVLHSRPEDGFRIKKGDSVFIVTPNSKLLGSLAKAGLVPTQLIPDAATRASVFDSTNFAIQNGEIGMVWVDIIKIRPYFAQHGRRQKSHENRYYSRILILLASAVRRDTPVILVGHHLGAWQHHTLHTLQETHGLVKSEHAWCSYGTGLGTQQGRWEQLVQSDARVTILSRPGIPSTTCRCPPGVPHRPDIRQNLAQGRGDLLRDADALFAERLMTTLDCVDPLSAHEVVSVGSTASRRGTGSTPDYSVHQNAQRVDHQQGVDVSKELCYRGGTSTVGTAEITPSPAEVTTSNSTSNADPQLVPLSERELREGEDQ